MKTKDNNERYFVRATPSNYPTPDGPWMNLKEFDAYLAEHNEGPYKKKPAKKTDKKAK